MTIFRHRTAAQADHRNGLGILVEKQKAHHRLGIAQHQPAIGPEVVDATVRVLDALGSPFAGDVQQAGVAGVTQAGDPLPEATLASIRKTRLALKGPLTTPIGAGYFLV